MVFHSSTITMMHGPINVRLTFDCSVVFCFLFFMSLFTSTSEWWALWGYVRCDA